jgi:quinol monooxygenase YgiN
MITLMGYVIVREGKMEEALLLVKELVTKVKETEPGTIAYSTYTSKAEGNENKIFFYETFEDEEAYQINKTNLSSFRERFGPIFDMSKNTITIWDPVI